MTLVSRVLAAVSLAVLIFAADLEAIDLTGTWATGDSVVRCRILQAGNGFSGTDNLVLFVTQAGGNELRCSPSFDFSTLTIFNNQLTTGVVAELNPTTGAALVTRCTSPNGTAFAIDLGRVSTFPPNGQGVSGRARVTVFAAGLSNAHFVCKGTLRRVSAVDPAIPACP